MSNQRENLAIILTALLFTIPVAFLSIITWLVLPDNTLISIRLVLSTIGLAVIGTATFFGGFKETYDWVLEQLNLRLKMAEEVEAIEPTTKLLVNDRENEYYSCFISFDSKDWEFAERLDRDLRRNGVNTWFAPNDAIIGHKLRDDFDKAVCDHAKLLLILSEHSVISYWVEEAVESAFDKERRKNALVLFPIKLDDIVEKLTVGWAASILRTRFIGNFTQWHNPTAYKDSFLRLLRDLQVED